MKILVVITCSVLAVAFGFSVSGRQQRYLLFFQQFVTYNNNAKITVLSSLQSPYDCLNGLPKGDFYRIASRLLKEDGYNFADILPFSTNDVTYIEQYFATLKHIDYRQAENFFDRADDYLASHLVSVKEQCQTRTKLYKKLSVYAGIAIFIIGI